MYARKSASTDGTGVSTGAAMTTNVTRVSGPCKEAPSWKESPFDPNPLGTGRRPVSRLVKQLENPRPTRILTPRNREGILSTITENSTLRSPVMRAIPQQPSLDLAIERAQAALLARQNPKGYWCAELQGDSILES